MFCLNCGRASETPICAHCETTVDYAALCERLLHYLPQTGKEPLWDRNTASWDAPEELRGLAFDLAQKLPVPQRQCVQMRCRANGRDYVRKEHRQWLLDTYAAVEYKLTAPEYDDIRSVVLNALVGNYDYIRAERVARGFGATSALPFVAVCSLGDFYIKTRRYDAAERVLSDGLRRFTAQKLQDMVGELETRRNAARQGKKEYEPKPEDGKKKYFAFLDQLGVEVKTHKKQPRKLSPEEHPPIPQRTDTHFSSFVAYDFETTGLSSERDSIIEIGAVKVLNGQIVESKNLVFQEFVHPLDRRVPQIITDKTGIRQQDVDGARMIWEVLPDFMDFVGDLPMVGFNNVAFDSKFLRRAGRYSGQVVQNPQFDVMLLARRLKNVYGFQSVSLNSVAAALYIENPQAHRALSDALTTARVFLRLKGSSGR